MTDLFVTLRELSAVTIVKPENVRQLCEEGRLVRDKLCFWLIWFGFILLLICIYHMLGLCNALRELLSLGLLFLIVFICLFV